MYFIGASTSCIDNVLTLINNRIVPNSYCGVLYVNIRRAYLRGYTFKDITRVHIYPLVIFPVSCLTEIIVSYKYKMHVIRCTCEI